VRFIQRSEPDHSMVSVRLRRIDGQARGEVFLPMRQRGETLTTHSVPEGGALSAVEALGIATAHAFDFRTDIAIVDEDGLWRREWGTLHRTVAGERANGDATGKPSDESRDSGAGDDTGALTSGAGQGTQPEH
jgi:hypothetical protein